MDKRNTFQRVLACLLLCAVAAGLLIVPIIALDFEDASAKTVPVGRQVCTVRHKADSESLVIGYMDNGSEVRVLGEEGDFYQIDCYDMIGYVAKMQVAYDKDGISYICCIPNASETAFLPVFSAEEAAKRQKAVCAAGLSMRGTPYVLGGNSKWGIDCSGLTRYAYGKARMDLNWIAQEQLANGIIVAREQMQPGDLVFFERTSNNGRIATHVGIYIGDGRMVHAGTSSGVVVVDLSLPYFDSRYLCARRIVLTDEVQADTQPLLPITQDINSSYWRENSQTQTESGDSF